MGHTDVVPVHAARLDSATRSAASWSRNRDGVDEVWGRGAVDMLNLTASMAVAFKDVVERGVRPRGDLLYFAVADEEAGSAHGARWVADHHPDAIRCDYLLTESGGLHDGAPEAPSIGVTVGEKGVAWRRLRVRGTPGHGSMPFRIDNALVKAAAVVQRLAEYRPAPRFHELWPARVESLDMPRRAEAGAARPGAHRRRARRAAERGGGRPPPRLHPHDVLAEPDRRRGDEDQRDPRLDHARRRRPHAAGRGHRRGRRPPAGRARRPRRPRRGRDPHGRPGVDQPHRHAAVGLAAAGRRRAVPRRQAVAAVHRRVHRRPRVPRARRDLLRRRPVQPERRRRRVRPPLPRPRRARRRRVARPHRRAVAARRRRPDDRRLDRTGQLPLRPPSAASVDGQVERRPASVRGAGLSETAERATSLRRASAAGISGCGGGRGRAGRCRRGSAPG